MLRLTKREKSLLEFLGDPYIKDHSNEAAAIKLGLKVGTIKVYFCRLTAKLKTDRIGLALYYYQPRQLVLDLQAKPEPQHECKKVEVKKVRDGSPTAACGKPAPSAGQVPHFKSDYQYKSLRPDFLEIP